MVTLLPAEAFAFLLVFVRLAALFALAPALGEQQIPVRIRVAAALGVTMLLHGTLREALPPMPDRPMMLAGLVAGEFLIGLMIAGAARILFNALNIAGTIIAFQTSLASSQQFDPTQGTQSAIFASFMSVLGVALIFATDTHLLMLDAMIGSYDVFPPGRLPPAGDFASLAVDLVARSFTLGIQMAAPFIVFGVVFNVGLGLIARLMPQLPVFFIAMPLNIFLGLLVLLIALPAMMMWFVHVFGETLMTFGG